MKKPYKFQPVGERYKRANLAGIKLSDILGRWVDFSITRYMAEQKKGNGKPFDQKENDAYMFGWAEGMLTGYKNAFQIALEYERRGLCLIEETDRQAEKRAV